MESRKNKPFKSVNYNQESILRYFSSTAAIKNQQIQMHIDDKRIQNFYFNSLELSIYHPKEILEVIKFSKINTKFILQDFDLVESNICKNPNLKCIY
jgi:hypothetical protein